MAREYHSGQLNAQHRAAYDAIVDTFAAINAVMPDQVAKSAREFVEAIRTMPHNIEQGTVLDLGCGHGRDSAWLETQGLRVVGADLSVGMLSRARAQVRGPLLQMDIRSLPFESRCFRGVWCNAALPHLPKHEAPLALAEIRRVVVPGGVCFAAIKIGDEEGWEDQSYGHPVPRFFARHTLPEFIALLGTVGLELVSVVESDGVPGVRWAHLLTKGV